MEEPDAFVDHYAVLQVSPACDTTALEAAYRFYAKQYHPDHTQTADVEKFSEVIAAYRVLRDPSKRAHYDSLHAARNPGVHRPRAEEFGVDEKTAISDAQIHERLLLHLYKRRRENAGNAGVGDFLLREMSGCSENHFDFHVWYLREKGFVARTEDGTLAITIAGIDHVIATSKTADAEKLLLAGRAPERQPHERPD